MTLDDALLDEEGTRWARFFGTHLPRRVLDLAFDLPVPSRQASRADLSADRTRERYAASANNRRTQLASIVEHVRTLNRSRVAPHPRFALAELALATLAPIGREAVADTLEGPGGVPEHEGRREALDSLGNALQVLLAAYQTVLESDYRKTPFWYLRARRRVHLCAHRILELILLIQQVRALRYQRLDGSHWRIANTVFRAMLDYEQVDIPLETVGSLLRARRSRDTQSLRELYATLQAPWILDFLGWPESLMPFVLEYFRSIRDAVAFLPEHPADLPHNGNRIPSETRTRAPNIAWTGCYRTREPDQDPGPDSEGPALALDYSVLLAQAAADFQELRKARSERNPYLLPRRFARLDPARQLAAGHLMVRIVERERCAEPDPRHRGEARDIRIHAGFQEVFAHLQAVHDRDGRFATRRQLSDLFAQRSAAIGEDHTATDKSLWYVVQEVPGRLRLQTQETRFTVRLAIGSFLAFGTGEAGIRRPRLGKVARIHRPESGLLLVDVLEFADYARPTAVRRADAIGGTGGAPQVRGETLRAILIYGDQVGWSLLMPEHERFWEHTKVVLLGGNKETALELAELRDLGEGFCLFRLRARLEQGCRPQYPQPSADSTSGNPDSESETVRPRAPDSTLGSSSTLAAANLRAT